MLISKHFNRPTRHAYAGTITSCQALERWSHYGRRGQSQVNDASVGRVVYHPSSSFRIHFCCSDPWSIVISRLRLPAFRHNYSTINLIVACGFYSLFLLFQSFSRCSVTLTTSISQYMGNFLVRIHERLEEGAWQHSWRWTPLYFHPN